ncbi:DUF2975 domain-containing protein [Janthinobacterium sp. CAN_S7]|uniref:DUF2975 domain-containing protein n=1 Tax=Janthinobacterium sp. CAN_S7 TaxID=3071704 RepID=UPI00319E20E4
MNTSGFTNPGPLQLTRMCQIIRGLLLTFLFVQLGLFLLSWIIASPLSIGPMHVELGPDGMAPESVHALSLLQRMVGMAVGLPGLLGLSYGIFRLGRALANFQKGKIFAVDTIGHLRASAGAMLVSVVLFNLEKPLRGVALHLAGSTSHYPLALEVTSNELLLILVCSLFYLIAGVMHEGRRISEENEGFI